MLELPSKLAEDVLLLTLIEINSELSSDDDEDELDVLVFPFWPTRWEFDAEEADGI